MKKEQERMANERNPLKTAADIEAELDKLESRRIGRERFHEQFLPKKEE